LYTWRNSKISFARGQGGNPVPRTAPNQFVQHCVPWLHTENTFLIGDLKGVERHAAQITGTETIRKDVSTGLCNSWLSPSEEIDSRWNIGLMKRTPKQLRPLFARGYGKRTRNSRQGLIENQNSSFENAPKISEPVRPYLVIRTSITSAEWLNFERFLWRYHRGVK